MLRNPFHGIGVFYDGQTLQKAVDKYSKSADTNTKFSLREGQTSLLERVSQYDNENGTEVERFFAFLDRGRSLEKGEKPIFHVGNSGDALQQYGIKGNIYVSTRTVSPYRHTKTAPRPSGYREALGRYSRIGAPISGRTKRRRASLSTGHAFRCVYELDIN